MIPITIFCILNLVIATISHKNIGNFLIACLVSSFICSITYQLIGFFIIGGFDPFLSEVLMKTTMMSFLFAVIVGIPFHHRRLQKISKDKMVQEENNSENGDAGK
ncbi:MAG: hypothetical protein R6V25_07930 [Desulfatiglandales bacterium]